VGLLVREIAVGTVLALAATCLFEGLRMGGQMVDALRGGAAEHSLVPMTEERTSPLGDLYLLLAICVFFASGGPALFVQALRESLVQLPLDGSISGDLGTIAVSMVLSVTGEAIRVGVAIAFPAALAVLLVDIVLGFMNRTAPQIQVFFLGMPLRAFLGIAAASLTLEGTFQRFCVTIIAT
jgi:flagellar biosynthetic protein FliR